MKKLLIGFFAGLLSATIILPLGFLIGQKAGFIPPFKESTDESDYKEGECQNINPSVSEYGSLKVNLLYSGSPAKNTEVDLAITPGPDNICYKVTGENGKAEFTNVPVGNYYIFFNMNNYPEEYGIACAEVEVEISKDETTEITIDLLDYQ